MEFDTIGNLMTYWLAAIAKNDKIFYCEPPNMLEDISIEDGADIAMTLLGIQGQDQTVPPWGIFYVAFALGARIATIIALAPLSNPVPETRKAIKLERNNIASIRKDHLDYLNDLETEATRSPIGKQRPAS